METIFIVEVDEVVDYVENDTIEAYAKKKDAKKRYDEIIAGIKQEYAVEIADGWEEEKSDILWEIYPDGYFSKDHVGVYLRTVEVQ